MIKCLEIVTFYPSYLEQLYNNNKFLLNLNYDGQINFINQDGFGINLNFVPFLKNLGFDTQLVIANNHISQTTWLKEKGLNKKYSLTPTFQYIEKNLYLVALQIESIKPDVVFFADTLNFHKPFFDLLNYKPKLVLGWRSASIPNNLDWSNYDAIISNSSHCLTQAKKLGAKKAIEFHPGAPTYLYDLLFSEKKETDIVFVGQITPEHKKRTEILTNLSKYIHSFESELSNISIEFYLSGLPKSELPTILAILDKGELYGLNMFKKYKQSKICLNIDIDFGKGGNFRTFEVTSVGSFLLTNNNEKISNYFTPGVEIEVFNDFEDLIEKIYYYLKNEQKREQISLAGYQKCLKNYSLEKKSEEFVEILFDLLETKNSRTTYPSFSINTETSVEIYNNKSPLTGEPSKLIWETNSENIISAYKNFYNIEVDYLFKNTSTVKLFECPTTKLQFFQPNSIYGDEHFYQELSKIPWYYIEDKWEYQEAFEFIQPNSTVLEVGCGYGYFLNKLKAKNCFSIGLELNPQVLENSRIPNILNEPIEIHSQKNKKKYDYVCMFQLLEHLPNFKEILEHCIQSLRDNGYLILSVPNNDSFISLDTFNILDMPPHHLTRWKPVTFYYFSEYFPLKLIDIKLEPLAEYHKEWFENIIKQQVKNEKLKNIVLRIAHEKPYLIKGHTMIVFFQKV